MVIPFVKIRNAKHRGGDGGDSTYHLVPLQR